MNFNRTLPTSTPVFKGISICGLRMFTYVFSGIQPVSGFDYSFLTFIVIIRMFANFVLTGELPENTL